MRYVVVYHCVRLYGSQVTVHDIQPEYVFAAGAILAFFGGLLFLLAAVERRRSAREFGGHVDRAWKLLAELLDHMMASSNSDGFAAVERKRAAARRVAERKKPQNQGFRWTEPGPE